MASKPIQCNAMSDTMQRSRTPDQAPPAKRYLSRFPWKPRICRFCCCERLPRTYNAVSETARRCSSSKALPQPLHCRFCCCKRSPRRTCKSNTIQCSERDRRTRLLQLCCLSLFTCKTCIVASAAGTARRERTVVPMYSREGERLEYI